MDLTKDKTVQTVETFDKGKTVAVFADNENLFFGCLNNAKSFPDYKIIMDHIRGMGRVIHATCISDWTRLMKSVQFVVAAGMEPMFSCNAVTSGVSDVKRQSCSDAQLICHVYETVISRPEIQIVVLITGDRDFLPLVHSLKRMGKYVIVMSEERSLAWDLASAADQAITLQSINALRLAPDREAEEAINGGRSTQVGSTRWTQRPAQGQSPQPTQSMPPAQMPTQTPPQTPPRQ